MAVDIDTSSPNGDGLDTSRAIGEKEKKLVIIFWKDIIQTSDWTLSSQVSCPTFQSVGWMVSETEDEIKIGGTLAVHSDDPQGTPFGITAFPRGCVQKIEFIS
jgi:hypothetical protein